jgi:hypothetical protein
MELFSKSKEKYLEESRLSFAKNYADLMMSYLPEKEFKAMKYYETTLYNSNYNEKNVSLQLKQSRVCITYSITVNRLKEIWQTRINHFGYGRKIWEQLKQTKVKRREQK